MTFLLVSWLLSPCCLTEWQKRIFFSHHMQFISASITSDIPGKFRPSLGMHDLKFPDIKYIHSTEFPHGLLLLTLSPFFLSVIPYIILYMYVEKYGTDHMAPGMQTSVHKITFQIRYRQSSSHIVLSVFIDIWAMFSNLDRDETSYGLVWLMGQWLSVQTSQEINKPWGHRMKEGRDESWGGGGGGESRERGRGAVRPRDRRWWTTTKAKRNQNGNEAPPKSTPVSH